jgi:hypothetical protein
MIVPSLWTNGFDMNSKYPTRSTSIGFFNKKTNNSNENENNFLSMNRFVKGFFNSFIPMCLYALALIEVVATTLSMIMKNKMTISLLTIMYQQIKMRALSVLSNAESMVVIKISIVKIILAGLSVKPLNMLIERCNRRHLWSPRRTMTYGGLIVSITSMLVSISLILS